jgi:hypothetical protein
VDLAPLPLRGARVTRSVLFRHRRDPWTGRWRPPHPMTPATGAEASAGLTATILGVLRLDGPRVLQGVRVSGCTLYVDADEMSASRHPRGRRVA